MRFITFVLLVAYRSFWERKLSCLISSKRNPSPAASRFHSLPETVKVHRQDGGLLPNQGRQRFVESEVSIQRVLWGPVAEKKCVSAHSHGPQLPRSHGGSRCSCGTASNQENDIRRQNPRQLCQPRFQLFHLSMWMM